MSATDNPAALRVPPHSIEAEQSIIGGVLLDPSAWPVAGAMVCADDFFHHEHAQAFRAMADVFEAGEAADPITVHERMRASGIADDDTLRYLTACMHSVPSASNLRAYCRIVRERAVRRELIAALDAAGAIAWDERDSLPVEQRIAGARACIDAVRPPARDDGPQRLDELTRERVERMSALAEGSIEPGIATGIPTLDRALNGGLRRGGLYVLGARPSLGKSSLGQWLALAVAKRGLPTLLFSMEMPAGEVADRAIAALGDIPSSRVQTGKLTPDEWSRVPEALAAASALPVWVDAEPGLTMARIAERAARVPDLALLVVDYLQLTTGTDARANRNAQIEEVSRGLKVMAKRRNAVCIVLSQLNRAVEVRSDSRPMLADLRDSGAIEQDADAVMMLWRAERSGTVHRVGLALEKNRHGNTGAMLLEFNADTHRWGESTKRLADIGRDRGRDDQL